MEHLKKMNGEMHVGRAHAPAWTDGRDLRRGQWYGEVVLKGELYTCRMNQSIDVMMENFVWLLLQ